MSNPLRTLGFLSLPDPRPTPALRFASVATACLAVAAVALIQPPTALAEAPTEAELEDLRVREDNQLLRKGKNADGGATISIAAAKAALVADPGLLTEAFGAPAAPEPVVVPDGMSPEEAALVATGQGLYTGKTCAACHSLDGNRTVGPTFKGLWGSTHKLADGSDVTVDDAYFAQSIKDPMSQVAEGFPAAMPPLGLTDDEIAALAAYVKTLK